MSFIAFVRGQASIGRNDGGLASRSWSVSNYLGRWNDHPRLAEVFEVGVASVRHCTGFKCRLMG